MWSLRHTTPSSCQIRERDILWFFIYKKEKENKNCTGQLSLLAIVLESLKFGRISTALKIITACLSLRAKFLNFVAKFYLACLVSMMESWSKNTSFFIAACKNDTRTKTPIFRDWTRSRFSNILNCARSNKWSKSA